MIFQVLTSDYKLPMYREELILLIATRWDDYGFKTTFNALFCDYKMARYVDLGTVKIAKTNMDDSDKTFFYIPKEFKSLPEGFFSLWQTAEA